MNDESRTESTTTTTVPTVIASVTIRNCDDVYENYSNSEDGVYTIYTGQQFVQVYCEFQKEGHNWMVTLKYLFLRVFSFCLFEFLIFSFCF